MDGAEGSAGFAGWLAAWWAWSVAVTLQASVLLALAWAADRLLLRRVWPQVLALLWLLALARFFLPPELGSPWSLTAGLGEPALAAARATPGSAALVAVFTLWIVGLTALLVARASGRARLSARIRQAAPSRAWRRTLARAAGRLGTRRTPRIGTLDGLATPGLFGLFRPVLLLPRADLERAPTRRDEHALLHELAHWRRGDLLLDELCALVRAALWFHPLAWVALARLHVLGELRCDQAVARALGNEARAYRDTLVLAGQRLLHAPAPRGVRAFAGRRSALLVRIERLERNAPPSPALVRGTSAALALALAACVLPMAPRVLDLRQQARAVLAAGRSGERQSCFVLQAATLVLADER